MPHGVFVPWGVVISLLSIRRLQVMAVFFLPNLYHTLIASLQSDDGRAWGEGEDTGDSWTWPGLCLVVSVP